MSTVHFRSTFFLALALTIISASAAASAPTTKAVTAAATSTAPAQSRSVTIDDSASQALEPSVSMHWKTAAPSRAAGGDQMVGTTTIRVHLNLAPWMNRSGRIYLSLPAQPPGPLSLAWVTQGRLLPGQLQSGSRVLVYSGPITSSFMEDTLTFQFTVNGALMRGAVPVSYHFEMDSP